MGRKGDDKGSWDEDGRKVVKGWPKGRAGKAPKGKGKDTNPRGFAHSLFRSGPTRGHSSTGHDRRGGWFFGR